MKRFSSRGLNLVAGGLFLGLLNVGCGGLPSPAQLESIAESTLLLRSNGNTVVLAKADFPSSAFNDLLSGAASEPPDATYRVLELNLDTNEQVLVDDAAGSEDIYVSSIDASGRARQPELANEHWRASLSDTGVSVANLAAGAEQVYLTELGTHTSNLSLAALESDRLIVQLHSDTGSSSLIVAIDLLTGRQQVFDRVSDFGGSPALSGDLLAFRADAPFDAQTQSLDEFFAGDRIELVDLSTGQRSVITDDLTGFSAWGPVFGDGKLIWVDEEYSDSGSSLRIESYVFADASRRTLAEFVDSADSGDYVSLIALNGRAALLARYAGPADFESIDFSSFEQSVTYVLRVFDGDEVTLFEQAFETPFDTTGPGGAVLTDDFAAVMDSRNNVLIAYDLRTGVITRTAVFAE
ncbi:MAG: hypothetical protein CHACPFDD_00032 [Phycisphaerae bacterium]|nr:hypothetical protein [Phycisphaerae bacterium]